MPLHWTLGGPASPPGKIYTACLGSGVTWTAGIPVAYSGGLVLANPATVAGTAGVKLVVLNVAVAGANIAGGGGAIALAKACNGTSGTGTVALGAFSGAIISPSTPIAFNGTGLGNIGTVAGSATYLGGTAGTGLGGTNVWQYIKVLGQLGGGTSTEVGGFNSSFDLHGDVNVLPGETIMLSLPQATTVTMASITWLEVAGGGGLCY